MIWALTVKNFLLHLLVLLLNTVHGGKKLMIPRQEGLSTAPGEPERCFSLAQRTEFFFTDY